MSHAGEAFFLCKALTMTIFQATVDHLGRLVSLFDGYRQFYGQGSDPAAAAEFLKDRLSKNESVIFLATEGDSALGFVQLYPSFSSVSLKRLWILNDLFVDPAGRRKGVAKALIKRSTEFALETKSKGLVLETGIENKAAQRLYQKCGWSKELRFDRYFMNVL